MKTRIQIRTLARLLIAMVLMVLALPGGRVLGSGNTDRLEITYLTGQAQWRTHADQPWQPAVKGMHLSTGAELKTAARSRIELHLPDGSLMRIAANSQIALADMDLRPRQKKRFGVRLVLGRLWSKVQKGFGFKNKSTYRVQTVTAVAGVRGTTFDVRHDIQKTTRVAVFSGQVGVAPPLIDTKGPRKEIAWPTQVSEAQWEEIILNKQQRLTIPHKGRPGQPESFDSKQDVDEWVAWNQSRDALSP